MRVDEIKNIRIWEDFIAKFSPQSLFQSWSWGEIAKKTHCNFWRLGIYDGDNLVGIAKIMKITARRGTFLHIRHGPIFTTWQKRYIECFLEYLKNIGKREKAVFIRVSPLIENSESNKAFFRSLGFLDAPIQAMDGEYCWVLDLAKDEEMLLSGMRKTTRYLIRQAQKMEIEIVKSKKTEDLEEFLKLYTVTAKRQQFVAHKGIRGEFTEFLQSDSIIMFKGYHEKKLISAALIVFYNNQAIYHHSASLEQKIPVNYLLQWEAIKEAKKRGKGLYNFWGVAPEEKPRHPWRGLSLFKRGFGGRLVEYLHTQDLPLSPLYCATYMIEFIRKYWKGY